jgi:hypothetical protein
MVLPDSSEEGPTPVLVGGGVATLLEAGGAAELHGLDVCDSSAACPRLASGSGRFAWPEHQPEV